MTLDATASGVFPIAPTPLHADGRIDEASIDRLIKRYLAAEVNGVTVHGILDEAAKLEPDEALAIAMRFINGFGSRPVIVGVSAPSFAAMRVSAHTVMERGAAGVMIAPPPSLYTDEQLAGYFRQVVQAIGSAIPFVLQDCPLTLTGQMPPSVICRIVEENPSCVMLKLEGWQGFEKISALRDFQKQGLMRALSILTGNGGLFLDFEMERGADGVMTGYAFPEMLTAFVRLQREGRRHEAHDLFDTHLPLLRYEQQQGIGLAVRKYVLMRCGTLSCDAQRQPDSALSAMARAEVDYLLQRMERRNERLSSWLAAS